MYFLMISKLIVLIRILDQLYINISNIFLLYILLRLLTAIVLVIYQRLCCCTNSARESVHFTMMGHYGPQFMAALHKHKRHRDVRRPHHCSYGVGDNCFNTHNAFANIIQSFNQPQHASAYLSKCGFTPKESIYFILVS